MFALAAPGRLAALLEGAGFVEVRVDAVDFEANYDSVDAYVEETRDLSRQFGDVVSRLAQAEHEALRAEIGALAAAFAANAGGALRIPARSLVAAASS
jgi:hypothetical protein